MNINTRHAYSEALAVINLLDKDYKDKIPSRLIEFFTKEKSNEHIIDINPDIPLEEQNLLQETIDILAMLKLSYWCFDETEKQELLYLLNENEKEYQKEIQEKYNPDNLFKNRNVVIDEEEQITDIIEHKKSNFIMQILLKIKELFSKNDNTKNDNNRG